MSIDCFSSFALHLLFFALRACLIIVFVFFWWKTATFIYSLGTIKYALLTCLIRLRCDTSLKMARTCCVAVIDSSKITELILATYLDSSMSPALPLAFFRGSPAFVNQNSSIFNGIVCWVHFFALNLCRRALNKASVDNEVGYSSIITCYSVIV